MGLYGDHIYPWFLDHTEPRELDERRRLDSPAETNW